MEDKGLTCERKRSQGVLNNLTSTNNPCNLTSIKNPCYVYIQFIPRGLDSTPDKRDLMA